MTNKTWRQLIRVAGVDHIQDRVFVVIPGWNYATLVIINFKDLPEDILSKMIDGQIHFHVKVNIDAEFAEDLAFQEWENK